MTASSQGHVPHANGKHACSFAPSLEMHLRLPSVGEKMKITSFSVAKITQKE